MSPPPIVVIGTGAIEQHGLHLPLDTNSFRVREFIHEVAKKIRYRMQRYFEVHSGLRETAYALHYFPEMVEIWRLEDWKNGVILPKELQEFMDPEREDYELVHQVFMAVSLPTPRTSRRRVSTPPRTQGPPTPRR